MCVVTLEQEHHEMMYQYSQLATVYNLPNISCIAVDHCRCILAVHSCEGAAVYAGVTIWYFVLHVLTLGARTHSA